MDQSSVRLFRRLTAGDTLAADEVFHRYVQRLIALARKRLSSKLARKVDPEDVVQSVYRSFFRRVPEGRFRVERGGDLWRLLAAITVRKSIKQVERFTSGRRDVEREFDFVTAAGLSLELMDRSPASDASLDIEEELLAVFRELRPLHRVMLERRLQGMAIEDIAVEVDRAERQVRRVLNKIRDQLAVRLL